MMEETAEQYKKLEYQRIAQIQSLAIYGMSLDERYDKETKFALQSAGLDLEHGDKVLDLASGVGGHSQVWTWMLLIYLRL